MAKPGPGQSKRASPAVGGGDLGGTESLAQLDFIGGVSVFSGNGAGPKLVNGAAPDVGDIWIRTDGGAGTTFYRCSVGGANPTWVALA